MLRLRRKNIAFCLFKAHIATPQCLQYREWTQREERDTIRKSLPKCHAVLRKHLAFEEIFPLCVFGLCFCQAPQRYHLAWDQFVWLWLSVSYSFKYMRKEGMQEQQRLNSEKYTCTFNGEWHWTPLFLILTPKGYDENFSLATSTWTLKSNSHLAWYLALNIGLYYSWLFLYLAQMLPCEKQNTKMTNMEGTGTIFKQYSRNLHSTPYI